MRQIDNQLIDSVERKFLPAGCSFDDERRRFIKTLTSCDLLAVPGSGKTTALQAKLACMTRCLEAGDGILVISHTNTAVEEIKKRLGGSYSILFQYPHSVCTVQEFVDTFLALPYYENRFGRPIDAIDDARHEEEINRHLPPYDKQVQYVRHIVNIGDLRFGIVDSQTVVGIGMECAPIKFTIPKTWAGHEQEYKQKVLDAFTKAKKKTLECGTLHYDDCYFLAMQYISKQPQIIDFLRKRFKYIFIDETQDLEIYQIDLIDQIFDCEECVLQRVGDNNQAIFNKVKSGSDWHPRNPMYLSRSLRLTPEVASIVNAFTLNKDIDDAGCPRFVVVGSRILEQPIKPHLILYDLDSIHNLENKFRELIETYGLINTNEGRKYGFHIVGWVGKDENIELDINKLKLESIFRQYKKAFSTTKKTFNTLSEFIQCGRTDNTMSSCKASVLAALCKVLRIARVVDYNNRYYTAIALSRQFNNSEKDKSAFEVLTFSIASAICHKQYDKAYKILDHFIRNEMTVKFGFNISHNIEIFLENDFVEIAVPVVVNLPQPCINIEISTVHHVKGMTHCATMYVETSYQGKYESGHLIRTKNNKNHTLEPSPYFREDADLKGRVYPMHAMKMLYVGMSRPTHLLCYASLKQNWDVEKLNRMREVGWEVLEL